MNLEQEKNELSNLINTAIKQAEKVIELRTLILVLKHNNKLMEEIENSNCINEENQIKYKVLFELNEFILNIAKVKHINLN